MSELETVEKPKNKGGRPRKIRLDPPASDTVELAYWASVQNSKDPADLESYLERWPEGHFASLAERRIKQVLQAEVGGGEPEDYTAPVTKRKVVSMPRTPIPVIGAQTPKYRLLAPFFAENDTFYAADMEIDYLGPPNEHMLPLNEAGQVAKKEQEDYLDACWAVKCKVEGRPVSPRPKELADQIEAERKLLRPSRAGVVEPFDLPPVRPDLAKHSRVNPNAKRVGAATPGPLFGGKGAVTPAPMLGRDGGRYQRDTSIGTQPLNGLPDTQVA